MLQTFKEVAPESNLVSVVDLRVAMEMLGGAKNPAGVAKALMHTEATAKHNYVHRGEHKLVASGHEAWTEAIAEAGLSHLPQGKERK